MQQHLLLTCTKEELQAIFMECLQLALLTNPTQGKLLPESSQATTNNSPEVILTTTDICQRFRVSKVTVHNWRKKKILPYHTKGRKIYFIESEVMDSLAVTGSGRAKNR